MSETDPKQPEDIQPSEQNEDESRSEDISATGDIPASSDNASEATEPAAQPEQSEADPSGGQPGNAADKPVAAGEEQKSPPKEKKSQPKQNGKSNGKGKDNRSSDNSGSIPWDQPLALIKFGKMRRVELFTYALENTPKRGEKVVIRTDRGVELGEIVTSLAQLKDQSDSEAQQGCSDGCEKCQTCPSANSDQNENPAQDDSTPLPQENSDQQSPAENSEHTDDQDQPVNVEVDPEVCLIDCGKMKAIFDAGSPNYAYHRNNRILRMASEQDISDQNHLDINSVDKQKFCRKKAKEFNLHMSLAGVEHLLGGERIVFYFTSESRVDFRELVRELASQYRTRIEMRQIGARDEARLAADYERCGQQCCCQVFLGELQPVSIRMAKVQKATLDPTKISGRCNRLMCCLRYEDATYEQLRRKLPRRNTWITTTELVGRVIDSQIITQLVRVVEPNGAVSYVNNDDIVQRNLTEQPAAPAPKPKNEVVDEFADNDFEEDFDFFGENEIPAEEQDQPDESVQQESRPQEKKSRPSQRSRSRRNNNNSGESGDKPRSQSRRRRRRPRKDSSGNNAGSAGGANTNNKDGNKNSAPKKNSRRRRRRKPRGGSPGNNNSGNSGS